MPHTNDTRNTYNEAVDRADGPHEPQWPAHVADLPLYLTPWQLAKLLGRHVRSLERDRTTGKGIPFIRLGKRILYPRDKTLAYLDSLLVSSTAEGRRTARGAA
jgi:hypothetical protein